MLTLLCCEKVGNQQVLKWHQQLQLKAETFNGTSTAHHTCKNWF